VAGLIVLNAFIRSLATVFFTKLISEKA